MKPKNYLVSLCVAIFFGCSNTNLQDSPYVLDDELSRAFKNIYTSLKEERADLLFSNGEKVNNCNSYFDLTSNYNLDESIYNQQVKSEYLICDALNILSNSPERSTVKIENFDFGEELLSRLDLRSFPSSLNRASSESSHTLNSLYPGQVSSAGGIAELQSQDWAFTMQVVALATINDNSFPDWIVWVFDESKSGNYRGYSTIILYDPEQQGIFNATPYP